MISKKSVSWAVVMLMLLSTYASAQILYDPYSVLIETKDPTFVVSTSPKTPSGEALLSAISASKFTALGLPSIKKIKRLSQEKPSQVRIMSKSQPVALYFDTPQNIPDLIKRLSKDPNITMVEPNYILQLPQIQAVTPNDPFLNQQYHIDLLEMPEAWALSTGNPSIVIAVIDTGIETTHDDLKNRLWVNTAENMGTTGVDNDMNGFIDDIHGWDFEQNTANVTDLNGHGTHVAGIAGAQANNSLGVAGIGFNIRIMPLKANINHSDGFTVSALVSALNYAVQQQADIINMSVGGSINSTPFNTALANAYAAGITIVAAAGNSRRNIEDASISPANHPNVITVSASNSAGEFASNYSNFGSSVDIMAPGNFIYATYLDNTYAYLTGTSMASPIVAGTVALLKSKVPTLTQAQIYNALTATALDKNAIGKDVYTGYGLVQPFKALSYLDSPQHTPSLLSGDYFQSSQQLVYQFISPIGINESSIVATINHTAYTTTHPALSFSTLPSDPLYDSQLTINFDQLSLSDVEVLIQLTYQDTDGTQNDVTITLTQDLEFRLTGPQGQGSALINAPNPFDPDRESTRIGFQLTQPAQVSAKVYSLQLRPLFEYTASHGAGYNEVIWDGRDSSGSAVPNGVYILLFTAKSDSGKSITKRHKMAVSRRK